MPQIAAIQTNSSDDVEQNLIAAQDYLRQAQGMGAELVVLPECFGFMQKTRPQLFENAESAGEGKIQQFLSVTAKELKVWIIGGSVPLKTEDPQKITNSLMVYDNLGKQVARYDKIFLFDVSLPNGEQYRESDYTAPGESVQVIDSPVGKIGLSICYDLRFPEMYRKLTSMGAEVLVVPSAFAKTTGQCHWQPLLRARAIENSCYVVAPAQTGNHPSGRKTWGHTVIIDPWGDVLAETAVDCGVICADIDLDKLQSVRTNLPSLEHSRTDLFKI